MSSVFLPTCRIYQDVINEDYYKRVWIRMENPIHILHKNCRGVSYTKRHHQIFIVSVPCPKSSLRNIFCPYTQLMIT
ncbi:hypothetical protein Lalb_Chr01g0011301 [Lupinus albus]|uniref:Uncharacterized protein n=1 Tax=Lupinus albus TaxID=3870 RepID=A0A6A4R573_LUPAL|nr:hypothetical protein Lalb_Chr01g0011301 [Lupinus albus]